MKLNESDIFTLAIAEKVLSQYKNNPFRKNIESFYNKIYYLYNDSINLYLNDLDEIITFKIGNAREIREEIFEKLKTAIKEFKTIECIYTTGYSGKTTKKILDPYHIINDKGEWYLLAYCHTDKFVKSFTISRFRKVELTKNEFDIRKDFDIKKYFENSFGIFETKNIYNVKLYFDKEYSRYIKEKVWHKSQKLKENKDGSIILEMKVNSLVEVRFWILSWGSSCKVMAPKRLRNEVEDEVKEMLKNYEDKKN